jgi:hypothetical protein
MFVVGGGLSGDDEVEEGSRCYRVMAQLRTTILLRSGSSSIR